MLKKIKVRNLLLHVSAWSLYITYFYIASTIMNIEQPRSSFYAGFVKAISPVFPFYFSVYIVYPACFSGERNFLKVLFILLLFILANWAYQFIVYHFIFSTFLNPLGFIATYDQFFVMSLNVLIHYSLFGLGFWYAKNLVKTERQLRGYETRQLQLENQKLQLQYSFLQAQINPHFLYNTIGFFHSKAMKFSKETAKGMELLSDIMRYSLNPATPDGKVPLIDEVRHLSNFIELHQIRFENALKIEFRQSGNFNNIHIPMHVLLTLVENAFKHGIFNENNPPLKIDLYVHNNNISFSVSNKISNANSGIQIGSSGIGLSNIRSRLEKEYGDKCRLSQRSENEIFTVELSIAA